MKNYVSIVKSILILMFVSLLQSCSNHDSEPVTPLPDSGDYTLQIKYDSVRSYPGGGGIFLFKIIPDENFEGAVNLKLTGDSLLNAKLSKKSLNKIDSIAEIIINPDSAVELSNHVIKLTATHSNIEKHYYFKVNVMNWSGFDDVAKTKRNEFKNWIVDNYPKYRHLFEAASSIYVTYPEILIVEHYTFIYDDYEMRLCFHVMIPPYDWSKLWLRKRHSIEPEIALKRETDGTIHEIPLTEYPTFFGY